jgi:hypothetical protein
VTCVQVSNGTALFTAIVTREHIPPVPPGLPLGPHAFYVKVIDGGREPDQVVFIQAIDPPGPLDPSCIDVEERFPGQLVRHPLDHGDHRLRGRDRQQIARPPERTGSTDVHGTAEAPGRQAAGPPDHERTEDVMSASTPTPSRLDAAAAPAAPVAAGAPGPGAHAVRPPRPRQCGRCRAMFPGDPTLHPTAMPDWWRCPTCRTALLGPGRTADSGFGKDPR